MNRVTQHQPGIRQRELLLFVGLVSLGAGLRLVFRDVPNFAPVAAISLFAGYCFRRTLVAAAVPFTTMLVSDWFIGAYTWQMMALVYAMLILPAIFGPRLRKAFELGSRARSAWRPLVALLTCSLGASLLFFAATNFGSWIWFDSYSKDWAGLISCYTAAIPFFRYTLTSDLMFAVILFGGYALAAQFSAQPTSETGTSIAS